MQEFQSLLVSRAHVSERHAPHYVGWVRQAGDRAIRHGNSFATHPLENGCNIRAAIDFARKTGENAPATLPIADVGRP